MKDNFTRIAVILDRSGSMETLRQATVTGFNEFIAGSTMSYAATGQGMMNTMRSAAYYVNAVRSTGQAVFTEEERKKAMAGRQDGDVA